MFSILLHAPGEEAKRLDFAEEEVTIGRLSTAGVSLKSSNVSKQHARIVFREGKFFLIDRKSTNGTFVNGKRVTAPMSLKAGDKIYVGDFSMTFLLPDSAGAAKPVAPVAPPPLPPAPPKPAVVAPPLPPLPPLTPTAAPTPAPEPTPDAPKAAEAVEPVTLDLVPEEEEDDITIGEIDDSEAVGMLTEERFNIFMTAHGFEELSGENFLEYRLDDKDFAALIAAKLQSLIDERLQESVPVNVKSNLHSVLLEELLGYGPLEKHLFDDQVEEIFINGPDRVLIHKGGRKTSVAESFSCEESLLGVLARLLHSAGVIFDESASLFNVTLPDGFNVACVFYPYSSQGTSVRISKPPREQATMARLKEQGVVNDAIMDYLTKAVAERKTIAVTGVEERDRVEVLAALGALVPDMERVALVNVGQVIQLSGKDQVLLEGSVGDVLESEATVGTGDILRHASLLAVERLVVRDVRETAAMELLYALNGGMAGSIFSVYGANAPDALGRLARMALTYIGESSRALANELIANNVHVVVEIKRFKSGERRVTAISEIEIAGESYKLKEVFGFSVLGDKPDKLLGEFKNKR